MENGKKSLGMQELGNGRLVELEVEGMDITGRWTGAYVLVREAGANLKLKSK